MIANDHYQEVLNWYGTNEANFEYSMTDNDENVTEIPTEEASMTTERTIEHQVETMYTFCYLNGPSFVSNYTNMFIQC